MNRRSTSAWLCCLTMLGVGLLCPAWRLQAWPQTVQDVYLCPMDPDVQSKKPGQCPKCGMSLRKSESNAAPAAKAAEADHPDATQDPVFKLKIPDTIVSDQDGRKLHFYTDLVKGRTVAINFIFTTCTTICPPLTATFRNVQRSLGDRVGRDIELISVSVDPTVDLPERLKSFAEKFHTQRGWTFVTGSKTEMDELLGALGAAVPNKNNHTPMVLIGNEAADCWTRAYGLAPASSLVDVIKAAADRRVGAGGK